jgi:HEAT repeat protein
LRRTAHLFVLALLAACPFVVPSPATAAPSGWAKKLSRNDPDEVFRTISEIAERKETDAALALVEAGIETKHPHLAIACGEALHAMGEEATTKAVLRDKDFLKRFRKLMRSKDSERQINMARVLGAWGHPWVDEHLAHLASGRRSPEVQAEGLYMAGALVPTKEEPFPETRDAILKALKGRSDEIKAAACSAAARRRERVYADALKSVIRRDRGDYAGLYAVWALKQIGWRDGVGSFIHVLQKNPKRTTRQANLKAVTELARLQDVEDLLSLSRHPSKDNRDAAVLALGRMAWRNWRVLERARGGEGGKGPVVTPPAEGEKEIRREHLPEPVLDVPDKVIDRMIQIVSSDRDWEVRDAARQALLRFGKRAQAKVRAAMPDIAGSSDYDAALTAMELCGLFNCTAAYKDMVKVAQYDKDATRRMFAARSLEGIDPVTAVKDLVAGLKSRKRPKSYELNGVRALGYIRHMDAYEYLVKLIDQEDFSEAMLREAEFALERLTGHRFGRKPDRWKAWMETTDDPFDPRVKEFNRQENRRAAVEDRLYGLTPVTEKAVEDGLRWLELQQHPIGSWDGNEKGFGGVIGCEPAYTGLSLLAFVGAGYNGARGKFREAIRRASEFLAASQFYDGGFPVTGGGDSSWIFAYLIGMGIWGVTESYGLSGDEVLAEPAQWGIDYLVRVQTPGGGWRYGPRYTQSDTSCTSWVLMTTKMADLIGLDVAQRSWDGIDSWLERCAFDITGQEEVPEDLSTDYDYEVGSRSYYKAFTGYLELSGAEKSALQQTSMTAVGMVCRFFMGWKRSHPFIIGSANYLLDYLPTWMSGLEKGMAIAWYHYYWYYGTLAMHQMGGRYWRAWNEKIKRMYPEKQVMSPASLAGSWDPDTAVLNGGRIFSTCMSILSLETYYRFSPLMGSPGDENDEKNEDEKNEDEKKGDDK